MLEALKQAFPYKVAQYPEGIVYHFLLCNGKVFEVVET